MGFTAAAAVICGALLPTGIGAVACAAIAYIVWSVIQSYAGVKQARILFRNKPELGGFQFT